MKNSANHLIFSEDGKSVHIQFANGKESFDFDTKEEAINAVLDCIKRKKISENEFSLFVEEIMFAENLESSSSSGVESIEISIDIKIPEIKDPYFKRCDCKSKMPHGHFYNGDGEIILPLAIEYQTQGQYITDLFCESEMIDERTRAHLNTMMEIAKIPFRSVRPQEN